MDVSVLSYEQPLVGAGWTISLVLNTNGLVLLVTIAQSKSLLHHHCLHYINGSRDNSGNDCSSGSSGSDGSGDSSGNNGGSVTVVVTLRTVVTMVAVHGKLVCLEMSGLKDWRKFLQRTQFH